MSQPLPCHKLHSSPHFITPGSSQAYRPCALGPSRMWMPWLRLLLCTAHRSCTSTGVFFLCHIVSIQQHLDMVRQSCITAVGIDIGGCAQPCAARILAVGPGRPDTEVLSHRYEVTCAFWGLGWRVCMDEVWGSTSGLGFWCAGFCTGETGDVDFGGINVGAIGV